MLKSLLSVWLLGLLTTTAVAQRPSGNPATVTDGTTTFTVPGQTTITFVNGTPTTKATSSSQKTSSATEASTATSSRSSTTNAPTTASSITSGSGSSTVAAPKPSSAIPAAKGGLGDKTKSSGMSSSEKIGLGVGLGVGLPLIAGAIVLLFFLRRRKRNAYRTESPSAQMRDQPAMSSAAPALVGVSDMGRSNSSDYSSPQTPSQHSLHNEGATQPSIIPSAQYASPRDSQKVLIPSPTRQEEKEKVLIPSPKNDTPVHEYGSHTPDFPSSPVGDAQEPVSPVSDVSPVGSRPPSPMNRER